MSSKSERIQRRKRAGESLFPEALAAIPTAGDTVSLTAASPLSAGHHIGAVAVTAGGKPVQARMTLGAVEDPAETEADRVAQQVMRMPAVETSEGGQSRVQRSAADITAAAAVSDETSLDVEPVVRRGTAGGGQPLSASARAFFEPRFGHDFSNVRVHSDSSAASSADTINAQAYTVGNDVVFGNGKYAPESDEGRHLLAHELTHVVQQGGGGGSAVSRQTVRRKENGRTGAAAKPRWPQFVGDQIPNGAEVQQLNIETALDFIHATLDRQSGNLADHVRSEMGAKNYLSKAEWQLPRKLSEATSNQNMQQLTLPQPFISEDDDAEYEVTLRAAPKPGKFRVIGPGQFLENADRTLRQIDEETESTRKTRTHKVGVGVGARAASGVKASVGGQSSSEDGTSTALAPGVTGAQKAGLKSTAGITAEHGVSATARADYGYENKTEEAEGERHLTDDTLQIEDLRSEMPAYQVIFEIVWDVSIRIKKRPLRTFGFMNRIIGKTEPKEEFYRDRLIASENLMVVTANAVTGSIGQ